MMYNGQGQCKDDKNHNNRYTVTRIEYVRFLFPRFYSEVGVGVGVGVGGMAVGVVCVWGGGGGGDYLSTTW